MKSASWFVYIIETKKGLLYTGITTNVQRRFEEHLGKKSKKKGAKFFNVDPPKNFVYLEKVENRSQATKREIFIKKLSRKEKIKLINENILTTKEFFQ
jgi:putative endonuclease